MYIFAYIHIIVIIIIYIYICIHTYIHTYMYVLYILSYIILQTRDLKEYRARTALWRPCRPSLTLGEPSASVFVLFYQ